MLYMSTHDQQLFAYSVRLLEEHFDEANSIFTQKLAIMAPDISLQQNNVFMRVVDALSLLLTGNQTLNLTKLSPYGIKPHHYGRIGEAFLSTLTAILGERFSHDMQVTWMKIYNTLAYQTQVA